LRTPREAAARLRCAPKTLSGYVESGLLRYVLVGRGTKRQRKMFTDDDLTSFIDQQKRKAVPVSCPSSKTRVHRIGDSTSNIVGIGFSDQPKPPRNAKPKR
jgi:hypothetical protein